jgi:hypoxanthine phosphoribosyltransferase
MQAREIEVLFHEKEIQKKVGEIAAMVDRDFQDGELVVVGVLKGAFVFMSDLVRRIKRPLACDFVRVASYEHDKSTGIVRMEFDMTQPITDKDVLLVEDIVDSGKTLKYLLQHLHSKGPRKIKVASLLYKEMNTGSKEFIDYLGFEAPKRYVVGYGLDSEGIYRSLPYIGAFK